MPSNKFQFKTKVWVHPGKNPWYLVTLPKRQSQGIMKLYEGMTAGFGSLPVQVIIGTTKWRTSIFPNVQQGSYILPLKKEVRIKEDIKNGDFINYNLQITI